MGSNHYVLPLIVEPGICCAASFVGLSGFLYRSMDADIRLAVNAAFCFLLSSGGRLVARRRLVAVLQYNI